MEVITKLNYSPNFQARPIAKTINHIGKIDTKIDIWELSSHDKSFLKKLLKNTNMKRLMPNICEQDSNRWKEMLEIAVDDTISRGTKTFLATTENKPCGIMSIVPGKNKFYTSCVCTWPIEVGKKVKLAGKTLFYQLFKTFEDSKAKTISLKAIQDGPFKTVRKYQELGFSATNFERLVEMEINHSKAKQTCKKLDQFIEYFPVTDGKNQNLSEILIV